MTPEESYKLQITELKSRVRQLEKELEEKEEARLKEYFLVERTRDLWERITDKYLQLVQVPSVKGWTLSPILGDPYNFFSYKSEAEAAAREPENVSNIATVKRAEIRLIEEEE